MRFNSAFKGLNKKNHDIYIYIYMYIFQGEESRVEKWLIIFSGFLSKKNTFLSSIFYVAPLWKKLVGLVDGNVSVIHS
jgi:hypothetical protein